ncbi:hypothetical protein BDR26DRAFT_855569 [Obelidium mucronatum]|nr:hypothetical protein BDR26DRAFT_855569 [Obelidium mucronatum]
MDLQMITDFAKEFGAGLLNFTVPNDFCLGLYTCLIKTIQHEKRWQTMTTLPLAVTAPSIDAIITFFTDLTLPEIPAPVHVHLLTLLVSQLMEMEKFHDFMEDEVVKNMESKRKQMVANGKRRTEVKGLFKTTEAEIETEGVEVRKLERELKNVRAKDATTVEDSAEKMDDIVCEEDGVGKMDCDIVVEIDESGDPSNTLARLPQAKPDRLSSREAEKKRRAAEYAINSKLSPLVKELNKKVTKLASLEREVQDLDRDDLELKQEIEALGSGLRVSRFLGMDRNYSSYFWIDLGSAEETAETSTSAKRYYNSEEDQPQTQNIRYINTIVQLKQLLKTLNDRGIRERDLLTHLRDRLKPYSLEFPAFPTTGNKRSWDRLGPADAENQVNKFFNRFGECLEGLGGLKDGCQDENVGEYREQVVEGVRERIRDLVLVMGSVYGPEESEEVKERFEGVTNMCLFSVAVGFVVRDVKAGKFSGGGADLEKKEGDTHERKKGSLDDDDDGSELKPRSCRARTVLPVIAKPEPRVMIKSDRSSRKARRDRLSKSIVQQKRTTRSSAKALDEESETDEITVQLTDGESDDDVENSDGNSESASDNDSDDSSQSIEEVIAAPAISRRKRNSSELDDHQVGRMTRSRHGSESKAPDAVDNNRKIEAIAKLAQSRSERIARRSK